MRISLGYILGNDDASFKELFNLYYPPLCVYASKFISDPASCEDIVQEAFAQLWAKRENIVITSSLRNYLVSTVKNLCIDFLRKNSSYRKYIDALPDTSMSHSEQTPDSILTRSELEKMLSEALDRLPETYRTVFEMRKIEGLSYDEISEKLNISIRSAKRYNEHAQKLLQQELKSIRK